MILLRLVALLLPQLLLGYFVAGSHDLLWGFNQTSAGFTTLLVGLGLSPLLCLAWIVVESRHAWKHFRRHKSITLLLGPLLAMLILVEALAIDLFILSHFRM